MAGFAAVPMVRAESLGARGCCRAPLRSSWQRSGGPRWMGSGSSSDGSSLPRRCPSTDAPPSARKEDRRGRRHPQCKRHRRKVPLHARPERCSRRPDARRLAWNDTGVTGAVLPSELGRRSGAASARSSLNAFVSNHRDVREPVTEIRPVGRAEPATAAASAGVGMRVPRQATIGVARGNPYPDLPVRHHTGGPAS